MGKQFSEREKYVIRVEETVVEVTREVYEEYYRMGRRERYLEERDQANDLIFFSALRDDKDSPDMPIEDEHVNVENEVIMNMFLAKLPEALASLTNEEIDLIRELYYKGTSVREYAKMNDKGKSTIIGRRDKILKKLRRILENED